jgi:hypothetical protein
MENDNFMFKAIVEGDRLGATDRKAAFPPITAASPRYRWYEKM